MQATMHMKSADSVGSCCIVRAKSMLRASPVKVPYGVIFWGVVCARHVWLHVSMAILLTVSAGAGYAANLLTNPSFPANVSSWTPDDVSVSIAWQSAGGGFARVTNSVAGGNQGLGMYQCVNGIVAGANYTFGGDMRFIGTGNSTSANDDLEIGIRWLDGANCTGNTLGGQPRLTNNTTDDQWHTFNSIAQVAPAGAVSVLFLAFPSKFNAGGALFGDFDNLYFDDGLPSPPSIGGSMTAVPTLSNAGLVLSGLALALASWLSLRRRNTR